MRFIFWKMIFWLVLKFKISYRVIIPWRILVSFRGFFCRLYFFMVKYLSFHNFSFASWYILINKWQGASVTHPFVMCVVKKTRWVKCWRPLMRYPADDKSIIDSGTEYVIMSSKIGWKEVKMCWFSSGNSFNSAY